MYTHTFSLSKQRQTNWVCGCSFRFQSNSIYLMLALGEVDVGRGELFLILCGIGKTRVGFFIKWIFVHTVDLLIGLIFLLGSVLVCCWVLILGIMNFTDWWWRWHMDLSFTEWGWWIERDWVLFSSVFHYSSPSTYACIVFFFGLLSPPHSCAS